MSEINVTLRLDLKAVEAEAEELRLLLKRLPDEVAGDIRNVVSRALDCGRLQIVFDDDPTALGAGTYQFVARWVGLDELIAAARRAADGEVDVFHGNPSVSGFDGCGDCDSTAGRDSHLFSKNHRSPEKPKADNDDGQ